MDIKTYLKDKKELIDVFLESYFDTFPAPAVLKNSMVYSLTAGGKRIRPILALASYEACGGKPEDIVPYASALEFIHTYSLIHDDLPAMDNDDLRRGKPTNHKVFGEGMAILAGDALLTEAFRLIAECGMQNAELRDKESKIQNSKSRIQCSQLPTPDSYLVLRVIRELALASGMQGMVAGQAEDIVSENAQVDGDTLSFIHSHKTGALITVSSRMGAILSDAVENELCAITNYGENIGLAFQIIDDILDIDGNSEELGKTAGSDERKRKMTYPGLYGVDLSMKMAKELINNAIKALEPFSDRADPLRHIAMYILERKS